MKRKQLIVNADDLGLSRGITDGIMLAHHEGLVTSASFLANQPASEYAIEQLRHAPLLDVGIHLNLCEGAPVLAANQVPSLVNADGRFPPSEEMIRRLSRWQVSSREIEAEFLAQIRWMKERGVTPTHADSHQHLHLYPCAVPAFRRALLKEGVTRMRAPRNQQWPRDGRLGPHGGWVCRRILVSTYMTILQTFVLRHFVHPRASAIPPIVYRMRWETLGDGWKLMLRNLPPGPLELGCHPGLPDPAFPENDGFSRRRQLELSILTHSELRSIIESNAIELITYPQLDHGYADNRTVPVPAR